MPWRQPRNARSGCRLLPQNISKPIIPTDHISTACTSPAHSFMRTHPQWQMAIKSIRCRYRAVRTNFFEKFCQQEWKVSVNEICNPRNSNHEPILSPGAMYMSVPQALCNRNLLIFASPKSTINCECGEVAMGFLAMMPNKSLHIGVK